MFTFSGHVFSAPFIIGAFLAIAIARYVKIYRFPQKTKIKSEKFKFLFIIQGGLRLPPGPAGQPGPQAGAEAADEREFPK